jgi:hypothetical protein
MEAARLFPRSIVNAMTDRMRPMLRIRPWRSQVSVREHVRAPLPAVFDRITDHESMRDWPGISRCELIARGDPKNGLGAIRRITAGGLTLDEKVVTWEPPHRYEYTIVRGLPVDHLGTVTLTEQRGGVDVEWSVSLKSRVPFIAELTGAALRLGLGRALRHFARGFAS